MPNPKVRLAERLHKAKRPMTYEQFCIVKIGQRPSSFWHDFVPPWLTDNGMSKSAKLTARIWLLLWDAASIDCDAYLKLLVAANPPTLRKGNTNLIYRLS